MSMTMLTILQITAIFAAYLGVALVLPWIFFRRKFAAFRAPARVMAYLMIGNFYIINLVYLLQLLHISGRLTLIAGTLAPFVLTVALKYRGTFSLYFERWLRQAVLFFGGETGKKTFLLRTARKIKGLSARKYRQKTIYDWIDILLTAGVVGLVLYMYGSNALYNYGYGASDVAVHNYWINEMGSNNIFVAGVYPFGMHCVVYYLHTVFAIPTYVVLRLFWLVQTLIIHMMLLYFLKLVCKSRYAPYIGTTAYIVSNVFYTDTYYRYYASLPQEFGMVFILPAAYFIIAFLRERMYVSVSEEQNPDHKKPNLYLVLFAISFSLTVTVHFYDTIVLGLFCVGIAVGFCFRCFQWRYLKRILLTGIIGILIAAFPMAAAYAMGKPLQGSIGWGMSIISGDVTEDSGEITENSGEVVESVEMMETGRLLGNIAEKLRGIQGSILHKVQLYVTNGNAMAARIVLGSIWVLFLIGILWLILRRVEYGAVLISTGIFMAALSVLLAAAELGIPQLMDSTRCSIYFAYGIGLMWSLVPDAVVYLLFLEKKAIDWGALAALAASCVALMLTGIKQPARIMGYESNGAVICLTNIIREDEATWTICSANDERLMVGDYGYHYELITFLRRMETLDENTTIMIPTSTVYFFIEKVPIEYSGLITTLKLTSRVSSEKAGERLSEKSGISAYQKEERLITMSRMYYWAQAFAELFPNEMEIYYESDEFICYRVKQNGYSLYNFAIDYGYNGSGADDETGTASQGG